MNRSQLRISAFTIIELLVVITVMTLLIALLLPALGKARDAAQINVCLGRQRQIFLGVRAYNVDNKEFGPVYTNSPNADNTIFGGMIPTSAAVGTSRSSLGLVYDGGYWSSSKLAYCPSETAWAMSKSWTNSWWSSVYLNQHQIEWNHPTLANQRLNSSYIYRWGCPNPHTALANGQPNLQSSDGQLFAMSFTRNGSNGAIGMLIDQTMDLGLSPATSSGTAHPLGGNALFFDGHAKFLNTLVNPYNPGNGPLGYYLGYHVFSQMVDFQ